jgi:hypothetical protein
VPTSHNLADARYPTDKDVRAVVADEDRDITDDSNSRLAATGMKSAPLLEECKLKITANCELIV